MASVSEPPSRILGQKGQELTSPGEQRNETLQVTKIPIQNKHHDKDRDKYGHKHRYHRYLFYTWIFLKTIKHRYLCHNWFPET